MMAAAPPSEGRSGGATDGIVIAVFGPTGVGKTAVASKVAADLGVRVISCDSMQIYRDFPVLTDQPSAGESTDIARHELVAVADASEEWSAGRYACDAQALIDEDLSATGWAVIAGGTGLYLRAALAPLDMARAVDPEVRASLERFAETEGPDRLHERLAEQDPEAALRIHPRNVRRVVRALEVIESGLGSGWSGRNDLWEPVYRRPTLLVGLTAERAALYARIESRAKEMVEGGAIDEVRRYLDRRVGRAAVPATLGRGVERAIGFKEIAAHLRGESTVEEVTAALAAATRRYVRRQLTWMRRLGDAVIIDASECGVDELAARIEREAEAVRIAGGSVEKTALASPSDWPGQSKDPR